MTGVRFPIEGVTYFDSQDSVRYRAAGAWVESTVGDVIRATAKCIPEKAALISEDRRMTYAELDTESEKLGAALHGLGLVPGDRALFQMGTVIETVVALFGCFKAGIIPVCSLPQYREIEMVELAQRSEARAWFVQSDFSSFDLAGFAMKLAANLPAVREVIVARGALLAGTRSLDALIESQPLITAREKLAGISIGQEDVLTFQLSGGTTGVPKIIPRFHAEYLGQARAWAQRNRMDANLVTLYALPLIHNAGQIAGLFPSLLVGGSMVLMQRTEPGEFLEWIEREGVTHSLNIGPAAARILDYADVSRHNLSSVKMLTTFNRADVLERHLHVPCGNIFGITEGVLMCSEPDALGEARFATVGRPVSNLDEIRLLELGSESEVPFGHPGELCFKGPSTTRGYFRMPEVNRESFTSDGFFRSGDVMRAHRIGDQISYSFEDRMRDNISRGGEKIGAEGVESVIMRHPDIADVKVVAMPDRIYGEKACAYLIMRPGRKLLTVKQLGDFLITQGLAKFKLPERIEGIDVFPVTRVGKLDKAALRRAISEKLALEEAAEPPSSRSQ